MEHKTWNFPLDGADHVVRLDWTYFTGRREVFVDGKQRHESVIPMRWRSSQPFEIEGRNCVVTTEPTWLLSPQFRISLKIDGKTIEPESGPSSWAEG